MPLEKAADSSSEIFSLPAEEEDSLLPVRVRVGVRVRDRVTL